jgi:hypothetical protein
MAVSNSLQLTINNATITQNPLGQYWPAMLWLGDNDQAQRFGQYSLAPSMLDQAQSYDEAAGSIRNPLAPYFDNSSENTRAGYAGFEVLSNPNGGTTAILRITTIEPILVSPFVSGQGSNFTSCFAGVQAMSYIVNFADLSRVLSLTTDQGTGGAISILQSGINVSISSFALEFQYLTPDPLYPIPRQITSSYFNITPYVTNWLPSVPDGATVSIPFNSVQLSSVPRRLIIFARERDQDRTPFTSDTYLCLPGGSNPLSITYDANQYFSQASTASLYNMSVKNGCMMSYSQYIKNVGSIIVIDCGIDLGLASNEAPGSLRNVQLGLTCNFTNRSGRDLNVNMYVLAVYEGIFSINNGSASISQGPISQADVLNARPVPGITYKTQRDVYGGNFFDSLKKAFGTANKFLQKNAVISTALGAFPNPITQSAAALARTLGYGNRPMRGGSLQDRQPAPVQFDEYMGDEQDGDEDDSGGIMDASSFADSY